MTRMSRNGQRGVVNPKVCLGSGSDIVTCQLNVC